MGVEIGAYSVTLKYVGIDNAFVVYANDVRGFGTDGPRKYTAELWIEDRFMWKSAKSYNTLQAAMDAGCSKSNETALMIAEDQVGAVMG